MISTPQKTETMIWPDAQGRAQPNPAVVELASTVLVFSLACLVFFFALGQFPLFNPDEGFFAEMAREMLESGNFLTTNFNYDSSMHYTQLLSKPPLCVWAISASFKLFGIDAFAARFFSACCGAVAVAAVHSFVAHYVNRQAALLSAATLCTAPMFAVVGRMAITDMPLTLMISGSLLLFYRAFTDNHGGSRWLAYALCGLGVMTKGPVAVVLPALVLLAYHSISGNLKAALRFYRPVAGALTVAAIALPWYIAASVATNGEYFTNFIVRENLQRFVSVVDKHPGQWWYHLAAISVGFAPWVIFLPQALVSAFRPSVKAAARRWTGAAAVEEPGSPHHDFMLYAGVWVIVTVCFFSISVSKLLSYTLPAFPALAALVGCEVDRLIRTRAFRGLLVPLALLAIVYGGTAALAPLVLDRLHGSHPWVREVLTSYTLIQFLAAQLAIVLAVVKRPRLSVWSFMAATFALSAYFGYQTLVRYSADAEGATADFARFAALSGEPIIAFNIRKPSILLHTQRRIVEIRNGKPLLPELSKLPGAYIITGAGCSHLARDVDGLEVVSREGTLLLMRWRRPGLPSPAN